jgi:septum formation protein
VRPAHVVERDAGDPHEVARDNALAKARAIAQPGTTTIGVDTLVTLGGEIFGKPASAQEASAMLTRLAGHTHQVVSGLALIDDAGQEQLVTEVTSVTFRPLEDDAIARYVATDEWRGRAGGYAIQERGAALVRRIDGDYLNVVGLPVAALLDLLPGIP